MTDTERTLLTISPAGWIHLIKGYYILLTSKEKELPTTIGICGATYYATYLPYLDRVQISAHVFQQVANAHEKKTLVMNDSDDYIIDFDHPIVTSDNTNGKELFADNIASKTMWARNREYGQNRWKVLDLCIADASARIMRFAMQDVLVFNYLHEEDLQFNATKGMIEWKTSQAQNAAFRNY